nr:MAG TPA: hypothetical protein [Caudoviricetes sp.]
MSRFFLKNGFYIIIKLLKLVETNLGVLHKAIK